MCYIWNMYWNIGFWNLVNAKNHSELLLVISLFFPQKTLKCPLIYPFIFFIFLVHIILSAIYTVLFTHRNSISLLYLYSQKTIYSVPKGDKQVTVIKDNYTYIHCLRIRSKERCRVLVYDACEFKICNFVEMSVLWFLFEWICDKELP